jgi:hypothetical protein
MNREILNIASKILSEEIHGRVKKIKNKIFENDKMKKQMCSECGGKMYEGECMECGGMYENMGKETCECGGKMYEGECMECGGMYEGDIQELGGMEDGHPRFGNKNLSKMSRKEKEELMGDRSYEDDLEDRVSFEDDDMPNIRKIRQALRRRDAELGEALKGSQRRIDKNKNNRIDAEDFKLLRKGKKTETKESDFPDLSGDKKVTRKDILLGRGVKLNGKKSERKEDECKECGGMYELHLDESTGQKFIFRENEIIEIIENIVLEEKKKKKTKTNSSKNITKSSQSKSKTENDKYIDSVVKKMKDYLKKGSKGSYEMNPKSFPKGNGEIEKMQKMAYVPSDTAQEYIDNFTAAGLENISYDEIHPNEDWVSANLVGSSKTGNNPEWANAVETGVGEKRNKIRKNNLLGKVKRDAYQKDDQPVRIDRSGGDLGDTVDNLMKKYSGKKKVTKESLEEKKILTDIDKMRKLIGYKEKTQ